MLPLSSVRPGDIRHIRFSFACSRRQTTRRQSEAPKDVPDHTSCRALSRHSPTDIFAGAPHPYYRTSAPFSFSVGERKIMNHFVVLNFVTTKDTKHTKQEVQRTPLSSCSPAISRSALGS